jgi:hypothetical protein
MRLGPAEEGSLSPGVSRKDAALFQIWTRDPYRAIRHRVLYGFLGDFEAALLRVHKHLAYNGISTAKPIWHSKDDYRTANPRGQNICWEDNE